MSRLNVLDQPRRYVNVGARIQVGRCDSHLSTLTQQQFTIVGNFDVGRGCDDTEIEF